MEAPWISLMAAVSVRLADTFLHLQRMLCNTRHEIQNMFRLLNKYGLTEAIVLAAIVFE